jgi:hypothetical protein
MAWREDMDKLKQAIDHLEVWQLEHKGNTHHRCLEAVRHALGVVGLKLPAPMASPKNTAFFNFEAIVADSAKYGWKQVHHPLPRYCLVYFKGCGKLADGRIAGHIALLDSVENWHYSNQNYRMNKYWSRLLIGAFVPL